MPREFHRILLPKTKEDLQKLIEDLYIKVVLEEKMGQLPPIQREMLGNLISFRKKLDDLSQEQLNILWETAAQLVRDIFDKTPETVIDEQKAEDRPDFLDGAYWVFPKSGRFMKCEKSHYDQAVEKISDFGQELGLDAWDLQRAIHSGDKVLMPLLLKAGAIIANYKRNRSVKNARFQLCNCSVPWLRKKMSSSPIWSNEVYVYDPRHDYCGDTTGLFFRFRRASLKAKKSD